MVDYVETQAETAETIRENGGAFVVTLLSDDRDTSTGEVDRTPTKYEGRALSTFYELKDIDGSLIQDKDIKFLVSALQDNGEAMPELPTESEILFGGQTFELISAKPLRLDGITTVYIEVQGRGVAHG